MLRKIFTFDSILKPKLRFGIYLFWIILALLLWIAQPIKTLPSIDEVFHAFINLYNNPNGMGLGLNIYRSINLNIFGITFATTISLIISYLSRIPFFYPPNQFVQWMRYIPIIGFNIIFFTFFSIGQPIKLAMFTSGLSFFLIKGMTDEIEKVERIQYNLAKVLGYKSFKLFTRVIFWPTLPRMIDVIAQNSAMGWLMLVSIETFNRTEGGIGAQIYAYSATGQLAEVYAYLMIIGFIAFIQDLFFYYFKVFMFPYVKIISRG